MSTRGRIMLWYALFGLSGLLGNGHRTIYAAPNRRSSQILFLPLARYPPSIPLVFPQESKMVVYSVIGATGNTGTSLIQILLSSPDTQVHAFCRNRAKLARLLPEAVTNPQLRVFEGSIEDIPLLASCVRGSQAVFLVASTNDNIPGLRIGQDVATNVLRALREETKSDSPLLDGASPAGTAVPKLLLLSSATIDPVLSRKTPAFLHRILLWSASNVYNDLRETEALLRAQQDWIKTIFVKPGALSIDRQRGHAISLTDESSPLSYLDLAAAMIEAADDSSDRYDMANISVVNTNGRAKFPSGTPLCILTGLLRHFFPSLHPYLPSNTGPG